MFTDTMMIEPSNGLKEREGYRHIPVMLNEVVEYLEPEPGKIFIDGTVGAGGHAEVLLKIVGPRGRLIGIDRDGQILSLAKGNLSDYSGQCELVHANYRKIPEVLSKLGIESVDGILLDLGISSFQLDNPERGFGFRAEGPLDMRMDQDSPIRAFDLINGLSEHELSQILREFGQERWHHRIARSIARQRKAKPIETTVELSDIVLRAMPRQSKRGKIHPATRTFQALRMAVNRELEGLEVALDHCAGVLKPGGRIAVIAFHSLEDRIVKHKFRTFAKAGIFELVFKKPLRPSDGEIETNPRARSARMRVAERRAV